MKQLLMSIKTQENFRSPLFIGANIQPDGSIIISCNIVLKEEAETLVAHLPIYLEVIFGTAIWQFISPAFKIEMSQFIFYNEAKCVIESPQKGDKSCLLSIQLEDDLLLEMAQSFRIHNFLCNNQDFLTIQFDLPNQPTIYTSTDGTGNVYSNDGDAATFRTDASTATAQTQQFGHGQNPSNNQNKTNLPDSVKEQLPSTGIEIKSSAKGAAPGNRQAESGKK